MTLEEYLNEYWPSDRAFARHIGVTPATISNLISGRAKPSWDMIVRIYWASGCVVRPNDWLEAKGNAGNAVGGMDRA